MPRSLEEVGITRRSRLIDPDQEEESAKMKWPDLKQISCSKSEKTSCMFFSKKAQLAYELSTYFKLSAVDFPLIFRPGYLLLKMV